MSYLYETVNYNNNASIRVFLNLYVIHSVIIAILWKYSIFCISIETILLHTYWLLKTNTV